MVPARCFLNSLFAYILFLLSSLYGTRKRRLNEVQGGAQSAIAPQGWLGHKHRTAHSKPQPWTHSEALRKREMRLENSREETLGLE